MGNVLRGRGVYEVCSSTAVLARRLAFGTHDQVIPDATLIISSAFCGRRAVKTMLQAAPLKRSIHREESNQETRYAARMDEGRYQGAQSPFEGPNPGHKNSKDDQTQRRCAPPEGLASWNRTRTSAVVLSSAGTGAIGRLAGPPSVPIEILSEI